MPRSGDPRSRPRCSGCNYECRGRDFASEAVEGGLLSDPRSAPSYSPKNARSAKLPSAPGSRLGGSLGGATNRVHGLGGSSGGATNRVHGWGALRGEPRTASTAGGLFGGSHEPRPRLGGLFGGSHEPRPRLGGSSGGAAALPPGASRLIASAGAEPRRDWSTGHAGGAERRLHLGTLHLGTLHLGTLHLGRPGELGSSGPEAR